MPPGVTGSELLAVRASGIAGEVSHEEERLELLQLDQGGRARSGSARAKTWNRGCAGPKSNV